MTLAPMPFTPAMEHRLEDELIVGLLAIDSNHEAARLARKRLEVIKSVEDCARLARQARAMFFG